MLVFGIFQTQLYMFFHVEVCWRRNTDSSLSDTIQNKPFQLKLLKNLHHLE